MASRTVRIKGGTLGVEAIASNILKVAFHPGDRPLPASLFVLPDLPVLAAAFDEAGLQTQELSARLHDDQLSFACHGGTPWLRESARICKDAEEALAVEQHFSVDAGESLHGLGQFPGGVFDWRDHEVLLAQSNQGIAVPFLISTAGYGILWDSMALTRFSAQGETLRWQTDCADGIRYYVIYGPDWDRIIAGYRLLTGQAPLYGRWAYGYWQSKERYVDAADLLGVARRFREQRFPIDNIIQDWKYWGDKPWSCMEWDAKVFPEPAAMTATLHAELHLQLMVTIWPVVGRGSAVFEALKEKGLLFEADHWAQGHIYDAYSAEGRAIYWNFVRKGLFDAGVDAFWMDGTEPEFVSTHNPMDGVRFCHALRDTAAGSWRRVLNGYSLMTTRAVYEGQRATTSQQRVFILSRSGFAGQQRYAGASWSGDIAATWKVLREQVAAGLNFSAAGLPYWTTDIGGFFTTGHGARFPDGCKDDGYRELYVRWFQFGAFCPLFRSHGTNTPREPWNFGAPGSWAYEALLRFARLRYRLLPYLYAQAWQITAAGGTLMRALAFDFRTDPGCRGIADQFMFGPALLVCPVLEPMFFEPGNEAEVVPGNCMTRPQGGRGVSLSYFRGIDFEQLVARTDEDEINGNWIGGPPAGLPLTDYSLRWEASLVAPVSGHYELFLHGNDGMRLWLDGALLIDSWTTKGDGTQHARIELLAGSTHELVVEYFHHSGASKLALWWRRPGPPPASELKPAFRELYLPNGCDWFDFWTETRLGGGQQRREPTPIGQIPLFVRAGSLLPLGPEVQYHDEKPWDALELIVYPGADADFTLYEDENDSYRYEQGAFSTIAFHWDDCSGQLRIDARQGSFPGMLKQRCFLVRRAGSTVSRRIDYSGEALVVAGI